jgi:xylulokinase
VAFGFDPDRAAPDLLCRLVVEGCLLNLYDGYARMPVQARQIRLTGGLASSPAWCQAVADIFDTETVPVEGEGAALGAAVHAAWVWERERGAAATLAETAMPFVAFAEQRRSHPRPAHAGTYALLRRLFRAVSRSARGVPGEDPHDLQRALTGAAG